MGDGDVSDPAPAGDARCGDMERICRHCDHENSEWALYCARCGAPIEAPNAVAVDAPPPVIPASAPPPAPPVSPETPPKKKSGAGKAFATLALILIVGVGWFVVLSRTARRDASRALNDPIDVTHDHHAPEDTYNRAPQSPENHRNSTSNRDNARTMEKTIRADDDVIDALYRLLSPQHVPILVTRVDDDRLHAQGTRDQLDALDRFARRLKAREHDATSRQMATYWLNVDQARALADALDHARSKIIVRRDGASLRVLASGEMHDAIRGLLRYVQPEMQSMVDISRQGD
ncbi:MAG: zinc ribbon domain-containing protein [Phycisphaerales bacterium]|nr:zinc ribbon domain-containing protein [Phycisphaerales bacterium]